jgi:hypothetical protein
MSATYQITTDQDDIVIRLPRASADQEALSKLLDYLELESIGRQSQLSEPGAEQIATSMKKESWSQVRHLFETQ